MISSLKLAEICGVSQGTVDRALHGRKGISPKTREMILKAAAEHGYTPNPAARELLTGKSKTVGAAVPQINSVFFMDLFTEIKEQLRNLGYRFVLAPYSDKEELLDILGDFSSRRYCATVVVPIEDNLGIPDQVCNKMKVLSLIAPLKAKKTYLISPDELETGKLAAEFLAEKGHKKAIHLTSSRKSYAILARTQGFLEKTAELNMQVKVIKDIDEKKIYAEIKDYQATAVFCHNDWLALTALRVLEREGVKVPEEVSILGVDNSPTFNQFNSDITTIQYPYEWVGKQIADAVNGKKINPKSPTLMVVQKRS